MSLSLRWRALERQIEVRWRGPEGVAEALTRNPALAIAAIIGPTGPQGPVGPLSQPVRIDASLASTWVLSHPLGRLPTVHVYLATTEPVLTDVSITTTQITVIFPSPQEGFVLAY